MNYISYLRFIQMKSDMQLGDAERPQAPWEASEVGWLGPFLQGHWLPPGVK